METNQDAINDKIYKTKNLGEYLIEECYAMVKYLSSEGKPIPVTTEELITKEQLTGKEIVSLHRKLAKLVAPARPKTIWLLYKEAKVKSVFHFLGPVGLIRRLMLTTFLSLAAFILLSLSPDVNSESITKGTLGDFGTELLLNLLYLLSAAAIGGCFTNLFQAHKYILNGTYDTKYECSYWIRFVMGLVAGLMLAVIIPVTSNVEANPSNSLGMITIPLLAMLGGFSASLVYRILNRLVFAVESLITGSDSDRVERQVSDLQHIHDQEKELEHKNFVMKLNNLKTMINQKETPQELTAKIDKMIQEEPVQLESNHIASTV